LEENRILLQRQRQLADAAQLWQQNGQQVEFLLQGIRLAEAEDLYIKHTDELSAEIHRFLAACLDAQQAQQQLTQRRLRRAQITALVMAGLGVTAFGFGSLAFWQKQTAQARAIEALNASADAQMLSHRQLEALVLSVKGGQQLQQMVGAPTALQRATLGQLEKVLQSTQEINRLEGHQGAVTDITYHPQGQSFASVSEDHHVKLWSKDGALLKIFPGKGVNITRIRFRPDGQQLAIATANGILQIWDGAGAVRRSFQGHQGYITSLAVNPNGQTFVSAGDDRTIKLWNWQGKLLKTYRGHTDGVSSLSFSPDGQMLASASWDKTIQLWSMKGQHLKTLKGHRDEVTEVVFSPDGQSLASASADRTIKLWQVADGTVETMTRKARGSHSHRDRINSIQFSPDGKRLASASADGTIGVWRRGGHLLETLNGPGAAVNQVVFSPDGRTLASVSADTSIRLWQVKGKAAAPVSDLQTLLRQSCHHLQTYLTTNPRVSSSDRNLCD
jgi:tricorn protease-like protein